RSGRLSAYHHSSRVTIDTNRRVIEYGPCGDLVVVNARRENHDLALTLLLDRLGFAHTIQCYKGDPEAPTWVMSLPIRFPMGVAFCQFDCNSLKCWREYGGDHLFRIRLRGRASGVILGVTLGSFRV